MNIIDYVLSNPRPFEEKDFNIVDSLVLSQLSYVKFEARDELRIKDYARLEYFDDLFRNNLYAKEDRELLMAASVSPRYRDMRIINHMVRSYSDEQFAAFTFDTGLFTYVAFRGTDGTMAGWRENFRLAYQDMMPSQRAALEYLQRERPDYTGGQSKGGYMASYAGIKAGMKNIHCFDSPGFPHAVAETLDGKNVSKYVAEASVIGVLLEDVSDAKFVKSDAFLISQHSPYSWKIEGDDFEYAKKLSPFSDYIKKVASGWLSNLPEQEKKDFVEGLFDILEENDIYTVNDLKGVKLQDARHIMDSIKDKDVEDNLKEVMRVLSRESIRSFTNNGHSD